ncbi:hypothetical protein [Blastococcus mobilis]|uniref:Uncharacterized protein n=1 Tax=Blastococcus mobilis TaxID=1938746 RepID=A0A238ZWH0_9ACTN|nr:hypothetical protein [Blastococcus mobilis]SNR87599.1 hypothetical protein SAMN06272737_13427 [Blastococcus mobilis]
MDCWIAMCVPGGASLAALAEVEHRVLGLGEALGGAPWVVTHQVRAAEGGHYAGSLQTQRGEQAVVQFAELADASGGGWGLVDGTGLVRGGGEETHMAHALASAIAHRDRTEGRVVRFPGQADLPEQLSLEELVERTVVEDVVRVGVAEDASPLLRTNGYVRLELADGRVRLPVIPWDDGEVCPFEQRDQHPCCDGH